MHTSLGPFVRVSASVKPSGLADRSACATSTRAVVATRSWVLTPLTVTRSFVPCSPVTGPATQPVRAASTPLTTSGSIPPLATGTAVGVVTTVDGGLLTGVGPTAAATGGADDDG